MILDDLHSVILERKKSPLTGSYVSYLLAKGRDEILKKIGEESVEVIIASKSGDRDEMIKELADLWFHCMVLMAEEGINHNDVFSELRNRAARQREKDV